MDKKKMFIAGMVVLALWLAALTGCASTSVSPTGTTPLQLSLGNQQQGIVVSGLGTVTVTPDIASISLGIEAQAATVSEAQAKAVLAMDAVMSALSGNGVDSNDIQTQQLSITQVTRWDANSQEDVVLGYRVTNVVTAKIRDTEKAGATIDAVVLAGGDLTRINNIYFYIEDPTPYNKEARDEAMADAKNKAQQLASLSGVTVGNPIYISENLYLPPIPIYRTAPVAGAPAPTTPISPGEMEISLSVQVVYAILD